MSGHILLYHGLKKHSRAFFTLSLRSMLSYDFFILKHKAPLPDDKSGLIAFDGLLSPSVLKIRCEGPLSSGATQLSSHRRVFEIASKAIGMRQVFRPERVLMFGQICRRRDGEMAPAV